MLYKSQYPLLVIFNKRKKYYTYYCSFAIKSATKRAEFTITYEPDFRQKIANSWPASIDDNSARADWGWKHQYDLESMTTDMLEHLK